MALQSHPRSLILAPIESAYATSYWSSIVTLVLSCPVSEILHPNFRGVPLGLYYRRWGSEERRPKLIIRVINFELVQPIYAHGTSTSRTDRQTDGTAVGRSGDLWYNTAVALRASRGKDDIVLTVCRNDYTHNIYVKIVRFGRNEANILL